MAYDYSDNNRFPDNNRQRGGQGPYGARGSYGQERDYRTREARERHQGDDDDERGFFDRAGDEMRSWFGDEDAQRRRERDMREDEGGEDYRGYRGSRYGGQDRGYGAGAGGGSRGNMYGAGQSGRSEGSRGWQPSAARGGQHDHDPHYSAWRQQQIDQLDRDYDEYRRNNQSKFDSEFGSFRSSRQSQRQMLDQIEEHDEVVGSDGEHVGTVDKVRGDRIILTKNDRDAGGHHHSIPSSWFQSHEQGKVTISKSADEAKRMWRDEERNQAMFGDGNRQDSDRQDGDGPHILNRSFSGTY